MLVQKFGGTSLANAERIKAVAKRVAEAARREELVVVVSAMGAATDQLIDLAREVSQEPDTREIDLLMATGEQVSASLLAMALHGLACPARSLAGWQAGIRTDSRFTTARIEAVDAQRIRHELDQGRVVIVTGFQGIASDSGWDEVTTLGRGGSDATAVALAAGLRARKCEIYTDVEGIFSADPRVVPDARRLESISYDEMLELAQHGAQVMMPRAVELAHLWRVPLEVRSSFKLSPGTAIEGTMEAVKRVAGVAHEVGVAKITLVGLADRPGIARSVFSALANESVHGDLIVQNIGHDGRTDLSFSVKETELATALAIADDVKAKVDAQDVTVKSGLAEVSVVGAGIGSSLEYAALMFGALADLGINIDMISTSGIRITCVIEANRVQDAVRALHSAFELDEKENANAAAG